MECTKSVTPGQERKLEVMVVLSLLLPLYYLVCSFDTKTITGGKHVINSSGKFFTRAEARGCNGQLYYP